jgi:hypothetical protein
VQKKIWLFTRSCFHEEFLKIRSYSRHRNHFDVGLKQTYSEIIQAIPMNMSSYVLKIFVLLLVKM